MREEEEPSWFARWEEQLPSPDELMPLSQTLITPDLALAFDIPTVPNPNPNHHLHIPPSSSAHPPAAHFDPADLNGNGGAASSAAGSTGNGADEPARTLKRPRLVWTPQLHKRFVDAVAHLGIKNAVPKTIMQLMSVDGLTRENVASHLQKYRLYLKRMQGLGGGGGGGSPSGGGGSGGPISAADAATEQLFATGPVPHHFLTSRSPAPEPYMPYVTPAVAGSVHPYMQHQQQQYYHQQRNGLSHHFGGFDHHGFLTRPAPSPAAAAAAAAVHHRMVGPVGLGLMQSGPAYADELEIGGGGGRRELTLFPTGDH